MSGELTVWSIRGEKDLPLPQTSQLARTGLILICCRLFLQQCRKVSLNIGILKLYTKGFIIEFAKWRAVTIHTPAGRMHDEEQTSFMVYTTKAGNQNTSDKATTMKKVLDSRKFRSVDCLLWLSIPFGVKRNRVRIAR